MNEPVIPINEQTRLFSLRSLNILDTPREERFDRLTRLARQMFDVPIALVSLVDENRQWFKSRQGLDMRETPRNISFCGHTILSDEILVVQDAKSDTRFHDNPLVVSDPKIRFYAGCPLRALDGSKIGTLCIIDNKPRTLSAQEITALRDIAELAEHELAAVQLATIDDLTRISNRRGFQVLANNSLQMCERLEMPASLVFMDLDKFKTINDRFGHGEGDRVLKVFADTMRSVFRDSDVYARLGGDEFVVLLTNTSFESANLIISRFRNCIARLNREENRGYDIMFSEGIIEIDCSMVYDINSCLGSADELMYRNKRLSRA